MRLNILNMKKIAILILGFVITNQSIAQVSVTEDNDIKNFRFGLKGDLSFDWLNIDNDKKFLANGVGAGYDWGMQMEFKLNNTVSIVTGLSLKSNSLKLSYLGASSADSTYYVLDKDEAFVPFDTAALSNVNNKVFLLENRKVSANYINIPVALKMKTKEIGYLTYFGQFGANIGVNTKSRATDDAFLRTQNADSSYAFTSLVNEKLEMTNGTQILRLGLQIGGGAEYNFSGSTSLLLGITYNHYFTNALRNEKNEDYLQTYDQVDTEWQAAAAKVLPGSVSITVGILF
ncbi:MAG: opacity protein-like surface antigen [Flavobacteriales bacterium]|jgi:opacity protein-like surface antigen